MDGPIQVPMRLNRLNLDSPVGGVGADMRLIGGPRTQSGAPLRRRTAGKDLYRGIRCGPLQSSVKSSVMSGGNCGVDVSSPPAAPRLQQEDPTPCRTNRSASLGARPVVGSVANSGSHHQGIPKSMAIAPLLQAHANAAPAPSANVGSSASSCSSTGGVNLVNKGPRGDSDAHALEDFIFHDLDNFWRWCPSPIDGLHRCGLLVKLFDYCGLTRKENKNACKVWRLDSELRCLGVSETDVIKAHQRIPYEAFVLNNNLLTAISRCSDARNAWENRRRTGRCEPCRSPLALWVLSIIAQETGSQQASVA